MKKQSAFMTAILFICAVLVGCAAVEHTGPAASVMDNETDLSTARPSANPTVVVTAMPSAESSGPEQGVLDGLDFSWILQTPKPLEQETIIGTLEIRGKELSVLSDASEEMLKISIGQFAGPELNEPGDVLLLGHNYADGRQFGALKKLEKGDRVKLTDSTNRTVMYEVFDMIVIEPYEIEKTATGLDRGLVLITCTAGGSKRLVVKCKPVLE